MQCHTHSQTPHMVPPWSALMAHPQHMEHARSLEPRWAKVQLLEGHAVFSHCSAASPQVVAMGPLTLLRAQPAPLHVPGHFQ